MGIDSSKTDSGAPITVQHLCQSCTFNYGDLFITHSNSSKVHRVCKTCVGYNKTQPDSAPCPACNQPFDSKTEFIDQLVNDKIALKDRQPELIALLKYAIEHINILNCKKDFIRQTFFKRKRKEKEK